MNILISVSYYLDNYSFLISSEIRKCDSISIVIFFSWLFGLFWAPCISMWILRVFYQFLQKFCFYFFGGWFFFTSSFISSLIFIISFCLLEFALIFLFWSFKVEVLGISHRSAVEANLSRNHKVTGLIPGLTKWVKDLILLWAVV